MNAGPLGPSVPPALASRLLAYLHGDQPQVGETVSDLIMAYQDQLYAQMLRAPDDQLAGYRGMLLCLRLLGDTLSRTQLQQILSSTRRSNA